MPGSKMFEKKEFPHIRLQLLFIQARFKKTQFPIEFLFSCLSIIIVPSKYAANLLKYVVDYVIAVSNS
jgi:hypothetical protein